MKKVVLTLVALVAMAGLVFAAAPEFKPGAPSISGSATLTFGFDIDASAFGISNASSGSLSLNLIPEGSDEKGAEGDVYGWIKLSSFKSDAYTLTNPGVEAKLFLGPIYINILGGSDKVDYAVKGVGTVSGFNIATSTVDDVSLDLDSEFAGLAIGLKDTSAIDITLGMASRFDWIESSAAKAATTAVKPGIVTPGTGEAAVQYDSAGTDFDYTVVNTLAVADTVDQNTPAAGSYVFYAKVGLKAVAGLTLDLGLNLSTATGSSLGFGAKAGYSLDLGEGMALKVFAGFDMKTVAAGTMPYELETGVLFQFAGSTLDSKFKTDVKINPGIGVSFGMDQGSDIDLGAYFYDGALISVVDLSAIFELGDLGDAASTMGLGVYAGLDLGAAKPYAIFKYLDAAADSITLEVGSDISVIPNTTFTDRKSVV